MFVCRKKLKLKIMAAQFWILILFVFHTTQVSAYSARRRDNNYLLHDTHQQQQQQHHQYQQIVQEPDDEDALKTGTGSSVAEMNFHPLGDFSGATTFREASPSSGETSLFEPHSQLLLPGRMVEHQQGDEEQQPHHHHNRQDQKVELLRLRPEDGLHLQELSSNNNYKYNINDLSAESGISSNNGNYADIDNVYKQDMPAGNYNIRRWNGDSAKDNARNVWSWLNDDEHGMDSLSDGQKRSAFHAIKRQRSRKRQAQFVPGISVGAMTNLGDFFDNLQNNLDFLEKEDLTDEQLQLLDGQHPLTSLKKEISMASNENESSWHNNGPHGTGAFIHAIRTYRPSSRIRNLISSVPDGYRGTNLQDPNYKWIGLGKRSYY